jgi:hypothetical protein
LVGSENYLHFFNLLASTTPKEPEFKLLRLVTVLNQLVDLDKILYGGDDIEGDVDRSKNSEVVQLLKRFVKLVQILYGGDDIEGDLATIAFNFVTSTIPQWRTFKLLRCVHILNRLVDLDEILHYDNDIKGDLDHNGSLSLGVSPTYNFLTTL